ncbi:MAG: helix-turn-helix transcriptional regulator [Candidatus Dormibacteria bacterium]
MGVDAPSVLLVASAALARSGMERLALAAGMVIAGRCPPAELEDGSAPQGAQLVLADADGDGLDTLSSLCRDPGRPVIALATMESPAAVLAVGAAACIAPGDPPAVLRAAADAVLQGLVVFSSAAREGVLGSERRIARGELPVERLTSRETEVLQLLAEGLTNPQAAMRLHLSEHTVKFHVTSVLGKLGAHTRSEAVARAARLGWIRL